ncbi:MAG: hypothetical protein WCD80_15885 [Desulfobaccales bacterium]
MRWNIIGGVIIGMLLLLWWAWPSPTHRRVYSPAEDAEMARVIRENWNLGIQQEKVDAMFDKQREENGKAMDEMLFHKNGR